LRIDFDLSSSRSFASFAVTVLTRAMPFIELSRR